MNITERAIGLPRLVLLAAVAALMLGVAAVLTLPKERTPRIDIPVVMVAIPSPGAAPATIEKQIIDKIEEEVENSLEHLKDSGAVTSQAGNGMALIQFVFDDGIDAVEAKRDVETLINRVKGQFPVDAQQDPGPMINEVAFEDLPIIEVFVSGGSDGQQRRRIAEEIEAKIEKIDGVAAVDIFGGLEREIQIEINPHLMTLYGFSYHDVETAVRRANTETPSGSIQSASGTDQHVRSRSKLDHIDAIGQVPVGLRDGKPLNLSNVAEIYMGHEPVKSLARHHGDDAVVLVVRAKADIDVMKTVNKIQSLVDGLMATHNASDGIQIGTVRSQAREIGYMLTQLSTSAAYGFVMVMLILWLAMGWRNAGLISLAVPFAILGTAAMMWFFRQTVTTKLTINNMSLFAMILIIGLVVDGSIVVGENIHRHRELGRLPFDAAKRGIHEVGGSLIAAYLTTFAAFAPMFMVKGVMGGFLEQLPVVVLIALCSAVLVDHFLLPVLSVYLMRTPSTPLTVASGEEPEQATLTSTAETEIINAESVAKDGWVKRSYGQVLRYALRNRLLVLALSMLLVATPVVAFMSGAIGFEYFPDSDIPIIEVYFELPLGSSLETRTAEVASAIEKAVMATVRPEEWYHSQAGDPARPVTTIGEPGALNARFDHTEQGTGPEFGLVYIELALAEDRQRSSTQIRDAITNALPSLPGVTMRVKSPTEGPPAGVPVVLRVMSRPESQVTIEQLADRAQEVFGLLRNIRGTRNVSIDYRLRPELEVIPNRTVASLFDIDAAQIATSVNYALEGVQIGEVDFGGTEELEMRLRNQPSDRDQVADLANLPLRSQSGKIVTLDQVAQIQRVWNANMIRHYDRQRVINVRCELDEGVLIDDVKAALVAAMRPDLQPRKRHASEADTSNRVIWSDHQMQVEFGGENQYRDEAFADLHIALIAAVAAMLFILTVKFNSFIQPLIILFSLPLSLVGVVIGLMLCGYYFSVAAMIGVVALSGIVVNDAIVMVDFINQMRNTGIPMERAVVYAGQIRLRPIFLTTVTTIGGLLPLGLNLAGGGEFFQPLTVTMMFGLGFATLLQLFVIPLLCYTFHRGGGLLDPDARDTGSHAVALPMG